MLEMADNQIRSGTAFVAAELEAALRNQDPSEVRATIERTIADPHYRALFMVGIVLFFISLLINYSAQWIVKKYSKLGD